MVKNTTNYVLFYFNTQLRHVSLHFYTQIQQNLNNENSDAAHSKSSSRSQFPQSWARPYTDVDHRSEAFKKPSFLVKNVQKAVRIVNKVKT